MNTQKAVHDDDDTDKGLNLNVLNILHFSHHRNDENRNHLRGDWIQKYDSPYHSSVEVVLGDGWIEIDHKGSCPHVNGDHGPHDN